jgi:hypothetical protein
MAEPQHPDPCVKTVGDKLATIGAVVIDLDVLWAMLSRRLPL